MNKTYNRILDLMTEAYYKSREDMRNHPRRLTVRGARDMESADLGSDYHRDQIEKRHQRRKSPHLPKSFASKLRIGQEKARQTNSDRENVKIANADLDPGEKPESTKTIEAKPTDAQGRASAALGRAHKKAGSTDPHSGGTISAADAGAGTSRGKTPRWGTVGSSFPRKTARHSRKNFDNNG